MLFFSPLSFPLLSCLLSFQDRAAKLCGGPSNLAIKHASAATGVRIHVPGRTPTTTVTTNSADGKVTVAVVPPALAAAPGDAADEAKGEDELLPPRGGAAPPLDVLLEGPFAAVKSCFSLLIEPVVAARGSPAREYRDFSFKISGDLVAPLIGE